jgi:hypothetical protein
MDVTRVEASGVTEGLASDDDNALARKATDGLGIPQAWRSYLRAASWLRDGWLPSGAYVAFHSPLESVRFAEASPLLPGALEIGGDGASERLVLDVRGVSPRVMLVNVVCTGWGEAIPQSPSMEAFLAAIEDGSFGFRFE